MHSIRYSCAIGSLQLVICSMMAGLQHICLACIHQFEQHPQSVTVFVWNNPPGDRNRPKGANYIAPTRLSDGRASLDPLRSVQFSIKVSSIIIFKVQYKTENVAAEGGISEEEGGVQNTLDICFGRHAFKRTQPDKIRSLWHRTTHTPQDTKSKVNSNSA